jgi:hypothetical protein
MIDGQDDPAAPKLLMSFGLKSRVASLIDNFEQFVDIYDRRECKDPDHPPTSLSRHQRTIELRLKAASVTAAATDDEFVRSLIRTLTSWTAFRPNPAPAVSAVIDALAPELDALEALAGHKLDDPALPLEAVTAGLWGIVDRVATALDKPDSPLVLGTKVLHHLLPKLRCSRRSRRLTRHRRASDSLCSAAQSVAPRVVRTSLTGVRGRMTTSGGRRTLHLLRA